MNSLDCHRLSTDSVTTKCTRDNFEQQKSNGSSEYCNVHGWVSQVCAEAGCPCYVGSELQKKMHLEHLKCNLVQWCKLQLRQQCISHFLPWSKGQDALHLDQKQTSYTVHTLENDMQQLTMYHLEI